MHIKGQGPASMGSLFQDEGRTPCSVTFLKLMHCLQPQQAHVVLLAARAYSPPVHYTQSYLLAAQQATVDSAFLLASIE